MAKNLQKAITWLQPGKHFIGLWVYRQWRHRYKPPRWVVTFWDRSNEYYETGLHTTPAGALQEAARVLKCQQRKGKKGRRGDSGTEG